MGERLNGIQEAGGSIPPGSTKQNNDLDEEQPRTRGAFSLPGNSRGNKVAFSVACKLHATVNRLCRNRRPALKPRRTIRTHHGARLNICQRANGVKVGRSYPCRILWRCPLGRIMQASDQNSAPQMQVRVYHRIAPSWISSRRKPRSEAAAARPARKAKAAARCRSANLRTYRQTCSCPLACSPHGPRYSRGTVGGSHRIAPARSASRVSAACRSSGTATTSTPSRQMCNTGPGLIVIKSIPAPGMFGDGHGAQKRAR